MDRGTKSERPSPASQSLRFPVTHWTLYNFIRGMQETTLKFESTDACSELRGSACWSTDFPFNTKTGGRLFNFEHDLTCFEWHRDAVDFACFPSAIGCSSPFCHSLRCQVWKTKPKKSISIFIYYDSKHPRLSPILFAEPVTVERYKSLLHLI